MYQHVAAAETPLQAVQTIRKIPAQQQAREQQIREQQIRPEQQAVQQIHHSRDSLRDDLSIARFKTGDAF